MAMLGQINASTAPFDDNIVCFIQYFNMHFVLSVCLNNSHSFILAYRILYIYNTVL